MSILGCILLSHESKFFIVTVHLILFWLIPQNVDLNDLNLNLCNYELEMDAFTAFRSHQLSAPRMLFMDHYRQLSGQTEDDSDDGSKSSAGKSQIFLEDLHMVSCIFYEHVIIFLAVYNLLIYFI